MNLRQVTVANTDCNYAGCNFPHFGNEFLFLDLISLFGSSDSSFYEVENVDDVHLIISDKFLFDPGILQKVKNVSYKLRFEQIEIVCF